MKARTLLAVFLATSMIAALLAAYNSTPVSFAHGENVHLAVRDAFPALRFDRPIDITHAGDGRLFVVEQGGRIWVLSSTQADATKRLFLDISDRVEAGGERGLLGLAFHPDYVINGLFYVNYTSFPAGGLVTRVAQFFRSAEPDKADPESEQILLEIEQPFGNHNGGDLAFDHDGMLIIALGDGGAGGDPQDRAQSKGTLLGKLLRIDVDSSEDGRPYAIPSDNPFQDDPESRPEIWALGLRNPWRIAFDRQTNDLYIGDVGQNEWEEVNFVPAAELGGQNFGWRLKEGNVCFNPDQNCDPGGLTDPIYVYSHDAGCSVTGGEVYHGSRVPSLQGTYLFADYCTGQVGGLLRDDNGRWQHRNLLRVSGAVSSFGLDRDGEVYIAGHTTGAIFRFVEFQHHAQLPAVLSK